MLDLERLRGIFPPILTPLTLAHATFAAPLRSPSAEDEARIPEAMRTLPGPAKVRA